MSTIDDLIAGIEVELEAAHKRHKKAGAEVQLILSKAQQDGRANMTAEEDERTAELFAQRDAAKGDIAGIEAKLANANKIKAEEMERSSAQKESTDTGTRPPARDRAVLKVGAEERTYRADRDPHGRKFLMDVARAFLFQDVEANYRLSQHMREEQVERAAHIERAVGTGAFAGLTVPQYLTDMYAPATAALRPFADVCNQHPLPDSGMSVEISRITTASSVGNQASQNTAVSETNMDDTLLSVPVKTAGGQQTISRQAIDRGTGIEDVVMQDLFNRYATNLDSTIITEATTGLSAVAQAVTYTDASPTATELYPKILNANANVEENLLAQAVPTHVVMHSRRWNWMQSQLSATWPFISQPSIPTQAAGVNTGAGYGAGIRGILPNGLLVVVDNNIATNGGAGTNEDEVYVIPSAECHLWEDTDAPVFIRAEQPAAANLGVLIVVYGYYAYTFSRYTNGMGKISGTGLVTPTF